MQNDNGNGHFLFTGCNSSIFQGLVSSSVPHIAKGLVYVYAKDAIALHLNQQAIASVNLICLSSAL
ncbi:MAG TPA: hypothetical protein V6D19_20870 [Stenomitos sp.]